MPITFPDGWEINNGEEQVIAQEPGNKIFMVLETVRPAGRQAGRQAQARGGLQQIAEAHMRDAGYHLTDGSATTINGLDAFVGTYQGKASGIGTVTTRGAHIETGSLTRPGAGGGTYFVGGIAQPDAYPRVLGDFNDAIKSFRVLDRNEADNIQPNRVDLYTAREGDTLAVDRRARGEGLREGVDAGHHEQPRGGRSAQARRAAEDRGGGVDNRGRPTL